jgi:radical SAM superfamily enzyme YgiQ (UPF0313 family)
MTFKMSCRSDEVEEETLRRMMAGGLTHVYMGVESGDEMGLTNMNKMLTPETHLRAGRILKSLGLSFDFGFMLMDPPSTFESIRNNISFLEGSISSTTGCSRPSTHATSPPKGSVICCAIRSSKHASGSKAEIE